MEHSKTGRIFAAPAAACIFYVLLAPPSMATAADLGHSIPELAAIEPQSESRWTVSVEAIALERVGSGVSRTLVERVPLSVPFRDVPNTPGVAVFNSDQFQQGFSAGPKIDLIYHAGSGYSIELGYFNIFDQKASRTIGPDDPADWLVMRAPAPFWQTQDYRDQAMKWSVSSNLYSAEANGRFALSDHLTVLAGFRWLQLNDSLLGTLTPVKIIPPFWNTITANNLYGVQAGVTGTILNVGRFSLGGTVKAGLFDNDAAQSTGVSLQKEVYPSKASIDRAAFVSEGDVELKYQLTQGLALKASYTLLWLDGVALAPGQIQETVATEHIPPPSTVQTLGVNSRSDVLFQGVMAGFEYSF